MLEKELISRMFVAGCSMTALLLLTTCSKGPAASFATAVPWGLTGSSLILDSHTHTNFSDGGLTVLEVVAEAVKNGCDALGITDHGVLDLRAAIPEYFDAVEAARTKYPDLIVFAGLEWDIPPYNGREHVTVLVDRSHERTVLPKFKAQFERKDASAAEAFRWLVAQGIKTNEAVLIYNHPSRVDTEPGENLSDVRNWRTSQNFLVGFEGGPGHQRQASGEVYRGTFRTDARWDPAVATIGGAWDRLLDDGTNFWGALAVSDYHNGELEFPPCSFARTHVRVPRRDNSGVLEALHAGSFWADHGRMLDDFSFVAAVSGLPVPVTPGESVHLAANSEVIFKLQLRRTAKTRGQPLKVEFIGNMRSGTPESLVVADINPEKDSFEWKPATLVPGRDGKTAYVRARVFAKDASGETLAAYANPIRFVLRK